MPTALTAPTTDRRSFLHSTALAAGALALPAGGVYAAGSDVLKIALVGCGGRGTGAAQNALAADPNVKLVAVADVFEDRAAAGLNVVRAAFAGKCDVPPERVFGGFDAYKQAIDLADVVVLATPPGFRPVHLAYAVEKGKHVFMEKPHAVDVPGALSVIESAKLAKSKNLALVSGFCYRYDGHKRQLIDRIRDNKIGQVQAIHTTYLTGELWTRASKTNDPAQMETQLRMWYYYTWLSGDFIVEQAIHNIDKARWVLGDELPTAATATAGRQVRTDPKFGNIFDHFGVTYDFASGAKVFLACRQINGCDAENADHILGSSGRCDLMRHTMQSGSDKYKPEGEHDFGKMYQTEHDEMFASIRAGAPLNDGVTSAHSTLMGIMGREAGYTGQRITWGQLMKSTKSLAPKEYAFGPNAVAPVARPGKTKFA